jgi:hypothetical protein
MTLLSAEQHRILARNLIKTAGTRGHRNKKQAEQQAQHHLNIALMIEHREKRMPVPAPYKQGGRRPSCR